MSGSKANLAEVILDYLVWLKQEQETFKENQHAREWLPYVEKKLLDLIEESKKSN